MLTGNTAQQNQRALSGPLMGRQRSATSTENLFLNCSRVWVSKSCKLQWNFQMERKQFVTSEILTILHFDKPQQINNTRLLCGGGRKGGCTATEVNKLCTVTSSHFCSHLHCQAFLPLCQICSLFSMIKPQLFCSYSSQSCQPSTWSPQILKHLHSRASCSPVSH